MDADFSSVNPVAMCAVYSHEQSSSDVFIIFRVGQNYGCFLCVASQKVYSFQVYSQVYSFLFYNQLHKQKFKTTYIYYFPVLVVWEVPLLRISWDHSLGVGWRSVCFWAHLGCWQNFFSYGFLKTLAFCWLSAEGCLQILEATYRSLICEFPQHGSLLYQTHKADP